LAINFKLGPAIGLDRVADDMSRQKAGWDPNMTDQQVYDLNRGLWVLGPRAQRERLATFSVDGTVRVVARIESIAVIPAKAAGRRSKRAIVGQVLGPGDPDYDALIGTTVDGHRNPVTYIADPSGGARACGCGCGAPVAGHRAFLPGHDQRAVHDRITRQWGSTLGFVDWFDATYPDAA
jgi:hypothetical protein